MEKIVRGLQRKKRKYNFIIFVRSKSCSSSTSWTLCLFSHKIYILLCFSFKLEMHILTYIIYTHDSCHIIFFFYFNFIIYIGFTCTHAYQIHVEGQKLATTTLSTTRHKSRRGLCETKRESVRSARSCQMILEIRLRKSNNSSSMLPRILPFYVKFGIFLFQ